jgi:hypothetical protein
MAWEESRERHFRWVGEAQPSHGFSEEQASALLGSSLLVGLTHVDADGEVALDLEFHGRVEAVEADGVAVRRADSGEVEWLPPVAREYEPAPAGHYRLRPGGEVVVDPDFLCSWRVERPPREA